MVGYPRFAIHDQQSMRQTPTQAGTGSFEQLTPDGTLRELCARVQNHKSLFDSGHRGLRQFRNYWGLIKIARCPDFLQRGTS
jgi:hypothetical protein